jgi:hypothetical protein
MPLRVMAVLFYDARVKEKEREREAKVERERERERERNRALFSLCEQYVHLNCMRQTVWTTGKQMIAVGGNV